MNRDKILKIATTIDTIRLCDLLNDLQIETVSTCILYKPTLEGKMVAYGYELRLGHKGFPTKYTSLRFRLDKNTDKERI